MSIKFKNGSRVRSRTSLTMGVVTERIHIEEGHEIVPPAPGSTKGEDDGAVYEERYDLRVKYTDAAGNEAEVLIHESDAEAV